MSITQIPGKLVTYGWTLVIGVVLLLSYPCPAATIVLDPGHGGGDNGAGNGKNFTEKQFTLALVQKIASLLPTRHRVELTRTSDIAMSPTDRAAMANHVGADLMISLHAGVTPYCDNRNAAVYYHNEDRLSIPSGMSVQNGSAEPDTDLPVWPKLQIRHQHQSQYLAATVKRSLLDSGSFDHVSVRKVPLAPLMGADLPAVLIEVGCLHPSATPSTSMTDQELQKVAQSIAKAIETASKELLP